MKFATGWWGVQILAESNEDKRLLEKLFDALPEEAEYSYEDGTVRKMIPADADTPFAFGSDEIADAKMVIEFNR